MKRFDIHSESTFLETLKLLQKTFPNVPFFSFLITLKSHVQGCSSVLDIGCGANSPLSYLHMQHTVGVDAYKPNLKKAKARKTHTKLVLADAKDLKTLFPKKSFDAVIALDVIEHLTKSEGLKLLKDMESIARKKVVIFTPNGFMPQHSHGDDLEEHLSGWDTNEMKKLKYTVKGFYGPKFLRKEDYQIRFKPKVFWGLFSEVINYMYTKEHSDKATALFCIKDVRK